MKNKEMEELTKKYRELINKYRIKYKTTGLTEKEADEIAFLRYQLYYKKPRFWSDVSSYQLQLLSSINSLVDEFDKLISTLYNQGAYERFKYEEIQYIKKNSDLLSFVLYENDIKEMVKAYDDRKKNIFRFYAETSYAFICGFHREKTASLGVTTNLGLYHCFGCGASGDIFNYVMDQYQLSFKNAVKLVANVFMIRLYETKSSESALITGVRNTFIGDEYSYLMEKRKERNAKLNYTKGLYNNELRNRVLSGLWDETLVRKDFKKPIFRELIDSERYYEDMVNHYFECTLKDYQNPINIDYLTDMEDTLFPDFEVPVKCTTKPIIENVFVEEVEKGFIGKEITSGRKNVALFYCDIAGTITPSFDEDYRTSYKKLISLLEEIRTQYNADELIFSLSTGDSKKDYLFHFVDKMKENITDESIVIGKQYMDTGCYDSKGYLLKSYEGICKSAELVKYVDELKENNNVVFVGFADDSIASYTIFDIAMQIPFVNNVYGFIPGNKNITTNLASYSTLGDITGLIKSIENYLNKDVIKTEEKEYYKKINEESNDRGSMTLKK